MAMRRVMVTGLGVVAPNGIGKDAFWSACKEGRSGVRPIRSFDPSGHPVKIAAEVPEKPGLFRVLVGPVTDSAVNRTRTDLQGAGFPGDKAIRRTF